MDGEAHQSRYPGGDWTAFPSAVGLPHLEASPEMDEEHLEKGALCGEYGLHCAFWRTRSNTPSKIHPATALYLNLENALY